MWQALLKVMGMPELAEDPRFKTNDDRWKNRLALDEIVGAWTRQHGKHDVMRMLGDAGVPCGACQDTTEVLDDPHLKARDMIVDVREPVSGKTYRTVGCPIKLSDSPVEVTNPPKLGEQTGALLADLCGISAEDLRRLKESGVV
jgi:formyl-CoA transferase